MTDNDSLKARLAEVRRGIAEACRVASREVDDVTLIVVTKFHPATLVRNLAELGVHDVGENRHQEAALKATELADLDLTWHFIGQLQSNKARAALEYADVIHSIDRSSLVDALDRAWQEKLSSAPGALPIDGFIQINLTSDPGRGGVNLTELDAFAEDLAARPAVNVLGVMAVAPLDEDPNHAFERVALASAQLQRVIPTAQFISAGMSHDYPQALVHGATHLRIGSAITGNRPTAG